MLRAFADTLTMLQASFPTRINSSFSLAIIRDGKNKSQNLEKFQYLTLATQAIVFKGKSSNSSPVGQSKNSQPQMKT